MTAPAHRHRLADAADAHAVPYWPRELLAYRESAGPLERLHEEIMLNGKVNILDSDGAVIGEISYLEG